MSHNAFEEGIGFDVSCRKRGPTEFLNGSIVWLSRPDLWIATVVDCLTKKKSRRGQRQKLYLDTCGKYLVMAAE